MRSFIRGITCFLIVFLYLISIPINILLILIPSLFRIYNRTILALLSKLDPLQECWFLSYLKRWQYMAERYPPVHPTQTLPDNPIEHISHLVQEVGVCPEVIYRCHSLAECYVTNQRWQEAEEILRRGYQLAYEWLQQPASQRCRSPLDTTAVVSVASGMLVALWVFEKCHREGRVPRLDSAYSGWLQQLAFGFGVDNETFWHVWYPSAGEHFKSLAKETNHKEQGH